MIYQFRCSFQESSQFRLEIDIDSHDTFLDLHHILQTTLGFQPAHLAAFYVPFKSRGHREIEITQLDTGNNNPPLYSMRTALIGEILSPGRKFLRYDFDLLNDRYLTLELTGTIMEKNLRKPVVRLNQGEAPVQVLDEVITGELYAVTEEKVAGADYGVMNDYYEIFGEMEEYVL